MIVTKIKIAIKGFISYFPIRPIISKTKGILIINSIDKRLHGIILEIDVNHKREDRQ